MTMGKPIKKETIKKEPIKKDVNKKKKGNSLVAKVQSMFAVGILFHFLAISYFKATIVYVLRFHCNLNENQSIMSFHMFQAATYFTTYFFGIIMSYSPMAAFIFMLFLYLVGGVVMAAALIAMPSNTLLVPLIPYTMLIFGFGVGAYKATIPKVLNPESKSIKSFFGCIFTELIVEILLVGVASMFLIDFEVFVFLALYIMSFLMIAASSIGPMTDPKLISEKTYKYANVINCSIYGVWKLFANYGSRLTDAKKEPRDNRHWLYRAEKKFGKDLVEALIIKFTLHKFYVWIAGIWIAVEVKYSYWMFTAYLSDRQLFGDMVLQPSQLLAIPPLIAVLFIPCFAYWLAPALKRSYYNTGVRQICLGAGFLLFACGMGWRMSAKMAQASTEFMRADFEHTDVRILNGHFCPSGILHYFPMNLEVAKVVFPRPAIETAFPVTKSNKPNIALNKMIDTVVHIINPLNEDTYLKYANLPFEDEEVGSTEQTSMQPTDSFAYLKKLDSKLDNAVTVASFGYCATLSRFTLDLPKLKRRAVDRTDVFLLRYSKRRKTQYVHYKNLEYKKSPLQKPGVRVYVVYRDNLTDVVLKRDGTELCLLDGDLKQFSPMIYVEVGDGPNLEIHALGKVVKFTHVLGPAEMIDLLVKVEMGMVAVKMLYVEPPLLVSFTEFLPQFVLVTFGEFLVGVIGLRYFVSVVPNKMQYYVFMDWYLVLGFSNLTIIAATLMPWVLLHAQLSYLTMIAGASACFLIVMASRFVEL